MPLSASVSLIFRVVVIDDLSNSRSNPDDELDLPPSLCRVKQLTGRDCLHFFKGTLITINRYD